MGLFKKKVVKEIEGPAWGSLVHDHQIDVDTLTRDFRAVEREGRIEGRGKVTLLRIFKPGEAARKGISITGWETFDQHPELVVFEGYMTWSPNQAFLERKHPQ